MSNLVMLRWYDETSREGMFYDTLLNQVFANFEWEPESHALATKAKQGDVFKAQTVVDTTFKQIVRIERVATQ